MNISTIQLKIVAGDDFGVAVLKSLERVDSAKQLEPGRTDDRGGQSRLTRVCNGLEVVDNVG